MGNLTKTDKATAQAGGTYVELYSPATGKTYFAANYWENGVIVYKTTLCKNEADVLREINDWLAARTPPVKKAQPDYYVV